VIRVPPQFHPVYKTSDFSHMFSNLKYLLLLESHRSLEGLGSGSSKKSRKRPLGHTRKLRFPSRRDKESINPRPSGDITIIRPSKSFTNKREETNSGTSPKHLRNQLLYIGYQ
jgi:hypothetical protein